MTATTYSLPRGRYSSTPVDGDCFRSVVTFNRTADTNAYTAGDVIGINASGSPGSAIHEFKNVGTAGGFILLQSAALTINNSTSPASGFRLHLFRSSPTAILDNAARNLQAADRANYIGSFDFPTVADMGDFSFSRVDYIGTLVKLNDGSTSLFGQLEALTGYTPASGTEYEIRLNTIQYGL